MYGTDPWDTIHTLLPLKAMNVCKSKTLTSDIAVANTQSHCSSFSSYPCVRNWGRAGRMQLHSKTESSWDLSAGFTCLCSSLCDTCFSSSHTEKSYMLLSELSLEYVFRLFSKGITDYLKQMNYCCEQYNNSHTHGFFLLFSPLLPMMKFLNCCTLHRMQTDIGLVKNILLFIWKFSIHR